MWVRRRQLCLYKCENFAYEHEETERHKTAMLIWGKKFPDITDRKQSFVLITKEEHMRRVAENEEKLKLKIAKNEERVRKSPKKGKFSGTEGEQPDLLELFKGHFLTDQDVVSKAKNESLPEKIDINHPSFYKRFSKWGLRVGAEVLIFVSRNFELFGVFGGSYLDKKAKRRFQDDLFSSGAKKRIRDYFFLSVCF